MTCNSFIPGSDGEESEDNDIQLTKNTEEDKAEGTDALKPPPKRQRVPGCSIVIELCRSL